MRRLVFRLVALVAILGQLQQLPAAVACAQQHQKATSDHCGAPNGANGPAIQGEHAGAPAPLCAILGSCAAQTPAVAVAARTDYSGMTLRVGASRASARPDSFSPAPATPPPQA